jgi:signal transduction histidine kinase
MIARLLRCFGIEHFCSGVILLVGVCAGLGGATAFVAYGAEAASSDRSTKDLLDQAVAALAGNPERAIQLSRTAQSRARAPGSSDPIAVLTADWVEAEATFRMELTTDSSRRMIERVIAQMENLNAPAKLRGNALLTRGAINQKDGRGALALVDFQEAYRQFVRAHDRRSEALALIRLASLYREADYLDGARRYFLQALEAASGDRGVSYAIYNGLGNVLKERNRFSEAAVAFAKALEYSPPGDSVRARILVNLARARLDAGEVEKARSNLAEAMQLIQGSGRGEVRARIYAVAARVELEDGNVPRARALIERSLGGIPLSETTLPMRDVHIIAAQIYRRSGEPAKAVEHLLALRRLDAQALQISTSAKAALMGARFDFQNQELRIARLKAEELRRNVEAERQRTRLQQIMFGGIAAAVAVLIAMLSFGLITIRRSRNEVRAANVDLGVANASLEKALTAKTEFLATTSHEIRTPLNGILGMTQVMLADPNLSPATRERVDVVHGAGMRMRGMVDDILDVAKMENGNFTIDAMPVDLPATLQEATRLWEEQAQGRGIAFSLEWGDTPQWVESDPTRLRQIVFNLLSNALKFTHRGSIGVRVSAVGEGSTRRLRIAVWDTGIGIPADKHAQIFESFRQVDAGTTRQYGGTGLGLTICRNLAIALGGHIDVESVEGEGSTFTVDLPLIEVPAPAAAQGVGGSEGMLVLDRNPIVRGMMKTLFAPHAPDLRFASTPQEALDELASGGIARVLIDEGALEANDDAAARVVTLVAAARASGVATAILWPNLDLATRTTLLAAGIDQVIAKPVSGAKLVEALFTTNGGESAESPLVSRAA